MLKSNKNKILITAFVLIFVFLIGLKLFIDFQIGSHNTPASFISLESVHTDSLQSSIEEGVDWLAKHQQKNGKYRYQFDPKKNSYNSLDNIVRQAGTAYSMAFVGKSLKIESATHSARNCIEYLLRYKKYNENGLPYVKFRGEGKLGTTALLLLAMVELDNNRDFIDDMIEFADSIISMQREDGSFITYFTDLERNTGQDYYPGEAMLAIIKLYKQIPDKVYLDTIKNGFEFYSEYWSKNKSTAFVAWQASTYSEAYNFTKDERHKDFVFDLVDWIIMWQYKKFISINKFFLGGFPVGQFPRNSSGSYMEGIADGYYLAKLSGERKKEEYYRKTLLKGARFLMQLQISQETSRSFQSPEKVSGGFRRSLVNDIERIDYTQHAVTGLTKILLYFDPQDYGEG